MCVVENVMKLVNVKWFIEFSDLCLVLKYVNWKIFMIVLYEVYVDGKLDFKCDVLEVLENCY